MIPSPSNPVRRPWAALIALAVLAGLFAAVWVVSAYSAERYGISFTNNTDENLTIAWTLRDLEGRELQRTFSLSALGAWRDEFVTGTPGTYILEVNGGPSWRATQEVHFGGGWCEPVVSFTSSGANIRQCIA